MENEEEFICPECAAETRHEILSRGRKILARCTECGQVHKVTEPPEEPLVRVKAIVSEEDTSRVCLVEIAPEEICRLGDHYVAECGDDFVGVEVTAIEIGPRRVKKARATDISALWTRKVEEVVVRVSLHDGRTTTPLYLQVPGEEPFVVGEIYKTGSRRFRISRIKIRNGAMLRHGGGKAEARTIKRIFAYPR